MCEHCGGSLEGRRRDARFCSVRCRKRADYARNGAEIQRQRRERYASDPEYKERRLREIERHRAKNPGRAQEVVRLWHERHRQDRGEYLAAWKARNPDAVKRYARQDGRRRRASGKCDLEWEAVLLADPCAYCGAVATEIDHIVPVKFGGTNDHENLTATCLRCNRRKNCLPLLAFLHRIHQPDHDSLYRIREAHAAH